MSTLQIPQGALLINAFKPQVNTAAIEGDYISCKTAHKVWVIFHMAQGHAAQAVLSLYEATDVDGTSADAVAATFPIWYNLDCATDQFTRAAADAATYTLDVELKTKLVIFQIDPSILSADHDCMKAYVAASNILNIIGCQYLIENRYKEVAPPVVITD